MMVPFLLNTAWMYGCRREAMRFASATGGVADAQEGVLRQVLERNSQTEYGVRYCLGDCETVAEYQQRVPLSTYEDYAPYVARIAEGAQAVLTRDRVRVLEPTSGTSGGGKLIPFTAALQQQFGRAVAVWMHDLLQNRPALRGGRAYWSISPNLRGVTVERKGVPVGFEDDASYLGGASRWVARRVLAVPSAVAAIRDMEEFRFQTLLHLLACRDLRLISVWSPTFLTSLLGELRPWSARLRASLPAGATKTRDILAAALPLPQLLRALWPDLGLISTWTEAGAALYLPEIMRLFPGVEIQPKGLLATEGCVSFPLLRCPHPVLAIRSHFFEFQEADAPQRIHLAHELETGGRYHVILTTAGGLYRYQLRDVVQVRGFHGQCPMLSFEGKADCISDLVGEKLSEGHARCVLNDAMGQAGVRPSFALLVPLAKARRYRLYLEASASDAQLAGLAVALEQGLKRNPHYRYARQLRQLDACEIVLLDASLGSAWERYERHCRGLGTRSGSVKPMLLDARADWAAILEPLRWQAAAPR